MTEDYIKDYLMGNQPFNFNGSSRYSTLVAGLRDCRKNTKRDPETGNINHAAKHGDIGNWLGTIGYFIVLDQIGSCFKKAVSVPKEPTYNKIKLAIEEFGFDLINNDINQLEALLALRNAFTHDFNLLNIPSNPTHKDKSQHKFTVTAELGNWIVRLPIERWNGIIESQDFNKITDITLVNLYGFGQLVETIYKRLCELYISGKIEIRLSEQMLLNKYTFVVTNY